MRVYVSYTRHQARIDSFITLSGKACTQEVERVCGRCCETACDSAADEGFEAVWQADSGWSGLKERGGCAVEGELDGAVGYVEEFGGYVTFPEGLSGEENFVSRFCFRARLELVNREHLRSSPLGR